MPKYDLIERTATFGERIIDFAKKIPRNPVTLPLISQLVRAGTSVGANYCEADNACSKRDFVNKIGLCKKESRETSHWLRMIAKADNVLQNDLGQRLTKKANELNLIFAAIVKKCKANELATTHSNL
jgi:four helix bundle protein